jgi:hypothetical protein
MPLQLPDNFDSNVNLLRKILLNFASGQTSLNQTLVKPFSETGVWQYATPTASPITTVASATLVAAATGLTPYVTSLQVYNTAATASLVTITSGGTLLWSGNIAASGANPISLQLQVPLKGAVGQSILFNVLTTGTSTLVAAQGYAA